MKLTIRNCQLVNTLFLSVYVSSLCYPGNFKCRFQPDICHNNIDILDLQSFAASVIDLVTLVELTETCLSTSLDIFGLKFSGV